MRKEVVDCASAQIEGQRMLLNLSDEVARDYLRVSRSTVYRLIEQGELRSVKVRGCTRVAEQEICPVHRVKSGPQDERPENQLSGRRQSQEVKELGLPRSWHGSAKAEERLYKKDIG